MPKIIISKQPAVIRADEFFDELAHISRYSNDPKFYYTFEFEVDQIYALQNDFLVGEISLYNDPPPANISILRAETSINVALNPYASNKKLRSSAKKTQISSKNRRKNKQQVVINNLRKRSSIRKDRIRNRNNSAFARRAVDLTKNFNNALARLIRNASANAAFSMIKPTRVVDLQMASTLAQLNVSPPLLGLSKDNISVAPTNISKKNAKQAAHSMAFNSSIDPAMVFSGQKTIKSAGAAITGTTYAPQPKLNSNPMAAVLLSAVLPVAATSAPTTVNFSHSTLLPVIKNIVNKFVTIKVGMFVKKSQLKGSGDFYVEIKILNSRGNSLKITRNINHFQNVSAYNTPRLAPHVIISPYRRIGKNSFEVKQVDKRATGIAIFRKHINPGANGIIKEGFKFIGSRQLSHLDGMQKIIDITDNSKIFNYRVLPLGAGGERGVRFTGVIASAIPTPGGKIIKRSLSCGLSAEVGFIGINVTVRDIPPEPIGVKVAYKNMTLKDREYSEMHVVGPDGGALFQHVQLIDHSDDMRSYEFILSSPKNKHDYKFVPVFVYEDGDEEFSTRSADVKFKPLRAGILETSVETTPVTSQGGGRFNFTFDVNSSLIPTEFDVLRRALIEQNLDELFSDLIEGDRERVGEVITHGIVRTNVSSGESSYLGTHVSGEFSDNRARGKFGVPALETGQTYRYTIQPQINPPETLFANYMKTVTDIRTNKQYSYSPRKWRNPIILNEGTIVTNASRKLNHAENDLQLGAVSSPVYVNATMPVEFPVIDEIRAFQVDRDTVKISWSVTGNSKFIDHFVLTASKLDKVEVIGSVFDGSGTTDFFTYDDIESPGQEIFYAVRAFYNNYAMSPHKVSNKVVV